jgi:hypothetical protein
MDIPAEPSLTPRSVRSSAAPPVCSASAAAAAATAAPLAAPTASPAAPALRSRSGFALPAAIFGIVIVGILTSGAFVLTDLDTRGTRNREDAATALRIAQTGATHGVSLLRHQLRDTSFNRLLRGFDNNGAATADNGLFIQYPGLGDSLSIPATGRATTGGRYYVRILNDPVDGENNLTDSNARIVLRCVGETTSGARAVVDLVVRYVPPLPAVAFDGNVEISGNPTIAGACGDIHVNGHIKIGGTVRVNSRLTVNGSHEVPSGKLLNASGTSIPPTTSDPVPIPTMLVADYCSTADYVMRHNGTVFVRATGATLAYNSSGNYSGITGWKTGNPNSSETIWESTSDNITPGSYCFEEHPTNGRGSSVSLSNNPGTASNPLSLSILASGSVQLSGNPYMRPAHPSGVTILAEGDLKLNGNATSGATNFDGVFYGGNQCEISGVPTISGQFLCKANPVQRLGAVNWVAENKISGDAKITYGCGNATNSYRYRIVSWYQRLAM